MDFLMELLFGLLFEAPAEAVMQSRRVKPWIKTTLYLLIGLSLSVLFGVMARSVAINQANQFGACVIGLICAAWTVFIIISAVIGHRRKWKKE